MNWLILFAFFAAQAGDLKVGKIKAASCLPCHGVSGEATNPLYPNLAGQNESYLIKQLKSFKQKDRKDPTMTPIAGQLSDKDIEDLAAFFASFKESSELSKGVIESMRQSIARSGAYEAVPSSIDPSFVKTSSDLERAKNLYLEKCAGCHGLLRQGAFGNPLTAEVMEKRSPAFLKSLLAGAANLTEKDAELMVKYLRVDPPKPTEWGMKEVKGAWKVSLEPSKRPLEKKNKFSTDNLFSVSLKDSPEVALIDGDSKSIVSVIPTRSPVHVSRFSKNGHYLYVLGRDGTLSLIDLWLEEPAVVSEIKVGLESRSIELSKFEKYKDKYLIVGSYWPPQFTILNAETLEPLTIVSTRGVVTGSNEFHPEPRVAAVSASNLKPEFVVTIKEAGKILLVDYSDLINLKTTTISADVSLHDGGWDASQRFFLAAANKTNRIAVVDAQKGKLLRLLDVGVYPHPGRGANFKDPDYGSVWATSHLGDACVSLISTNLESSKVWQVVRTLQASEGALFIKTHPRSKNLWIDSPLNASKGKASAVSVFDVRNLKRPVEMLPIAEWAGVKDGEPRVLQPEYNSRGDEVWFSVWNGKNSAIVVLNDADRKLKAVIKDPRLESPTGKFNAYNTRNDVY